MSDSTLPLRVLGVFALLVGAAGLAACGSPGHHVEIDVPEARTPTPDILIRRDVGRLLSADVHRSEAALRRLTTLDPEGVEALEAHAAKIPAERDPRWLLVLDENHRWPALSVEEELAYLVWKVERDEPFYVMKAQSRLLDLAARDPDALVRRLEQGGRGTEALAVALAIQGEVRSVPPLLERYRSARSATERRAVAEALAHIVGDDLRPRARGTEDEVREDAGRIERWYEQERASSDD